MQDNRSTYAIIQEDPLMDKDHIYRKFSIQGIESALKLSPNAFKLYMYLAKNKQNYKLALSKAAIYNMTGMVKNTYKRAKQELIENGYLTIEGKHLYTFHQNPVCNKN